MPVYSKLRVRPTGPNAGEISVRYGETPGGTPLVTRNVPITTRIIIGAPTYPIILLVGVNGVGVLGILFSTLNIQGIFGTGRVELGAAPPAVYAIGIVSPLIGSLPKIISSTQGSGFVGTLDDLILNNILNVHGSAIVNSIVGYLPPSPLGIHGSSFVGLLDANILNNILSVHGSGFVNSLVSYLPSTRSGIYGTGLLGTMAFGQMLNGINGSGLVSTIISYLSSTISGLNAIGMVELGGAPFGVQGLGITNVLSGDLLPSVSGIDGVGMVATIISNLSGAKFTILATGYVSSPSANLLHMLQGINGIGVASFNIVINQITGVHGSSAVASLSVDSMAKSIGIIGTGAAGSVTVSI